MTTITALAGGRSAISRLGVAGALAAFGVLALLPWTSSTPRLVILAGFGGAFALCFAVRAFAAAHGALIGALYLAPLFVPAIAYRWPLPSVVTIAAYAAVVRAVPALRASARFAARGRLDRPTALLGAAFVVLAAIALVVWRFASGADMTVYRELIPPGVPTWLLFVAIVPYAALNAVVEETIWRGALWEGVAAAFGRPAALAITAMSFGVMHYHGFPSGVLGVGLATIYGVMMGVVRWRTGGIFWPAVAHVFADVVIFTMVAAMVV